MFWYIEIMKDKIIRRAFNTTIDINLVKAIKLLSVHKDKKMNLVVELAMKDYIKTNKDLLDKGTLLGALKDVDR